MSEMRRVKYPDAFWYAVGGILLAASLFVRVISYPVVTSDYTYFVSKWFAALATQPGLSAFADPFANYAPLYLYLLKGLTWLPVDSLISAKSLSFAFDIALAVLVCAILRNLQPERWGWGKLFFAFSLLLSIPTIAVNSTLWAQSDSIYAAFILGSLLSIFMSAPIVAVLLFGMAVSFKIQSIFFLPVLAGYLAARRELMHLLWIPAVFLLTIIPAAIGGGNPMYWLFIYAKQAGEYPMLTVNAPSMYAFMSGVSGGVADTLTIVGIALAALAGLWIGVLVARARSLQSKEAVLRAALLCVTIVPFLLPRMHERYFYLADVFSVLYALYRPRYWYLPVLVVGASLLAYLPYLSDSLPALMSYVVDLRIGAASMLVALMLLVWTVVRSAAATPTPLRQTPP